MLNHCGDRQFDGETRAGPRPALSTRTSPPCSFTRLSTIARSKPKPPRFRWIERGISMLFGGTSRLAISLGSMQRCK
jgi:hypothetical protein